MKGIKFERAKMPIDAVSTKMDAIIAVDAAEHLKIVGVWVRFRLADGSFSCSHLIGRALLADEDSTIPGVVLVGNLDFGNCKLEYIHRWSQVTGRGTYL